MKTPAKSRRAASPRSGKPPAKAKSTRRAATPPKSIVKEKAAAKPAARKKPARSVPPALPVVETALADMKAVNVRVLDVRDAAARLVAECARGSVAVLFGNERTGLTNEVLSLAHALLRIPANPGYSSLNLAMAVQLVGYEIWRARGALHSAAPQAVPLATAADMERLYAHLAEVLEQVGFRDRTASGTHLMERLRRLLNRAELDQNEANILRGILTAIQGRRRMAGARSNTALPARPADGSAP